MKCDVCGNEYCDSCTHGRIVGIITNVEHMDGKTWESKTCKSKCLCDKDIDIYKNKLLNDLNKKFHYAACPNCGFDSNPTQLRITKCCIPAKELDDRWPILRNNQFEILLVEAVCTRCNKLFLKNYYWCDGNLVQTNVNWQDSEWYAYSQAKFSESVERIEDAAKYYEQLGMLDKAKELRIKDKEKSIKYITIDLEKVLNILKENNYTVPYKCPHCKAIIKLNGQRKLDNFLTCEYCGTSLQAIDVQKLIEDLV